MEVLEVLKTGDGGIKRTRDFFLQILDGNKYICLQA